MVPDHESKVMVPFPTCNSWLKTKHPTTEFKLRYHDIVLDTTTIPKHQRVVWCKVFKPVRLGSLVRRTDGQTDAKAIAIAKLEPFHMTNQRRILGIIWYEFVTNVEVATLS